MSKCEHKYSLGIMCPPEFLLQAFLRVKNTSWGTSQYFRKYEVKILKIGNGVTEGSSPMCEFGMVSLSISVGNPSSPRCKYLSCYMLGSGLIMMTVSKPVVFQLCRIKVTSVTFQCIYYCVMKQCWIGSEVKY